MPFIVVVFIVGLTQLHFRTRSEHEEGKTPHVALTENMEYDDIITRWIRGEKT